MEKIKYKGVFSLPRTVIIMYAHAYSERQAWLQFCRRIAKKHGVHVSETMNLFRDGRYTITEENKDGEL